MRARFRDESGFGLIELLIALVILNVGLFALIGAFNGATVAMSRAGTVSAATAVADKQMEIYRGMSNCAIWLDANTTPNTTTFPAKGSGSLYEADTNAYANVSFFDKSQNANAEALMPWSTNKTVTTVNPPWIADIEDWCTLDATNTPPPTATQAIQTINGPDGAAYPVYTYIVLVQPAGGGWLKRVTVVVRSPTNVAKVLARETSLFNKLSAP